MQSIKEKLVNVRFENLKWKNEIIFYKNELSLYLERIKYFLEDHKNDVGLQNQMQDFISQINELQKDLQAITLFLKIYQRKISNMAKLNGALKEMTNGDHEINRDQMNDFKDSYKLFKRSFLPFLENNGLKKGK